MPDAPKKPVKIAAPTGTRDFYPREMLVRRYITDAWRRTALRHGFDEIDGPTFETAELYKVKSGEGILNEMFGVFSGKAESARSEPQPSGSGSSEPDAPARGFDPRNPPFGLRPEFTPTLARMYAARAKQLPQPTKWFCVSNFFRAERPQRGRLREFWQWNADMLGQDAPVGLRTTGEIEILACLLDLMWRLGFSPEDVKAHVGHRGIVDARLRLCGVEEGQQSKVIDIWDAGSKLTKEELARRAREMGLTETTLDLVINSQIEVAQDGTSLQFRSGDRVETVSMDEVTMLGPLLHLHGIRDWCTIDLEIVRGLAYYTGTVFEVIAEGERAVAGGGRYDNLIELFGGPPTPACGFGMGDAVLGNLLEDRKLIPEGREMLEALSRPMPLRPDVFVIASPNEGCEALIVPTVARLRRGEESEKYKQGECKPWSAERYTVPPLHARRSYKATKNVGKLLAEASACHARSAAIIESPERCTLKNLDSGAQAEAGLEELGRRVAAR